MKYRSIRLTCLIMGAILLASALAFHSGAQAPGIIQNLSRNETAKDPGLIKFDGEMAGLVRVWADQQQGKPVARSAKSRAQDLMTQHALPAEADTVEVWVKYDSSSSIDEAALLSLGVEKDDHYAVFQNFVQMVVPLSSVVALSELPGVLQVSVPPTAHVDITSEGVARVKAANYTNAGFKGQGIKIGILDLGFAGYSSLLGSELPSSVTVRSFFNSTSGNGDITGGGQVHGTACAEIVFDMAPSAQLYLVNYQSLAEMDAAVQYLRSQGVKIITHSVGWWNQSFYDGQGPVSDIVTSARNGGVLWVNSAGNEARKHWEGFFSDSDGDGWNDFAAGPDELIDFNASAGDDLRIFLTWDDWKNSTNDYDLYLYFNGSEVASSRGFQTGLQSPTESISYHVPQSGTYGVGIKRPFFASLLRFELFISPRDFTQYNISSTSLLDPAVSTSSFTAGAMNYSANTIENFSSIGPTTSGVRKPDITGPDGVSTSTFSSFFGTSAASPHVAGAAALVWSQNTSRTASDVQAILQSNAVDFGPVGADNIYGSGMLNLPTIATSITIGQGAPNPQLFINAANRNSFLQFAKLPPTTAVHRWNCDICDPNNPNWGKGLIQDFDDVTPGVHDALMMADTNTSFVAQIYGGMWDKFIQLGGLNYASTNLRMLGYPVADRNCGDFNNVCFTDAQLVSPFGTSYHYQRFQGGALVLHRSGSRSGQTFEVHGPIRTRWQTLGGPDGSYGLPISDEFISQGKRRSDFQGGSICFNPTTNQTEDNCITTTTTRILTVASANPATGVTISVSPNDNSNLGSGSTQFARTYNNNTNVTLSAPSSAGGNNFQKWQRDGTDWSSSVSTSVTMDANHTMTAVYVTPPQTRTLTVASSNPSSGVFITVSPNDNSSFGSGSTQFARTYNLNATVNLTAPVTTGGNNFQKWLRDGVDWSSSVSTSVTMDANHTMTALYVTPPQTRMLTVTSSNPSSGVFITVSPNDNSSVGSGSTQFTRTYNLNATVNLTAPATAGGNNFQKWQRDGVDWSSSLTTNVTMDANHTMTVVYTNINIPITLSASPGTVNPGGTISVTWTAPGSHLTTDWVGLYRTGAANSSWIDYKYVPGGSGGLMSFTAPATPGAYEFRYLPNNGFTSVATSNSVTVPGANDFSISANPPSQSITPGGSTTLSVGTQTVSGSVQTIALSVSGLPSGATPSFSPPSVSSGNSSTLTITTTAAVPLGTYPLTITGNNSSITHSTGVTLVISNGGPVYSLTASPGSVSPGGAVTVNWTAPSNHLTTDWVGLFKVGTANSAWLDYRYVPAGVSGSFVFIAPATSGSYEFRYLPNNDFVSVAASNPFTVGSTSSDFSLSATPPNQIVKAGNSTSFSIGSATIGGNPQTITLGVTGLPSGASGSFNPPAITSGNSSTLNINTSATTPLGSYPLTITGTGTSAVHTSTVTLIVSNLYSLNATPETVRPGNIITVTWFAPSGHSTTDWVGLYRPGAADTAFITFQYLNSGTFGGLNFTAPASEGGYEFRLYPNNGFTRAATSNTVAVSGAVTLIAIPGNVGPGASVSVQWSTTTMSAANDWIGLYAQGSPDTNFISFQYIGSAGTIGLKSFTMPSKNGAYEFRYFLTDTYAKAATSNTINLTGGTAVLVIDDLFSSDPALLQFNPCRFEALCKMFAVTSTPRYQTHPSEQRLTTSPESNVNYRAGPSGS